MFICASCTKDFQELNTTHNAPSSTTIGPLINRIDSSLFLGSTEQGAIHNDYYYPITQLAATAASSAFVLSNGVDEIWNNYYSTLQDINLVQDKINAVADQESMKNIQAVLYILRAYKTFRATDQFGDIPYFKAGKAYTGSVSSFRVAYDSQQLIYDSLLADLAWAVKNINTAASPVTTQGNAYQTLGSYETFLGGDMTKWQKFANSLRLRYAMQMVEKDAATATPIIQDALNNGVGLIGDDEDICLWPASLGGYDVASRWFSFSTGGTGLVRMSSTMWNMVSNNTTDAGIFDPRAKLFVETNAAGNWAPYVIGVSQGDNINAYTYASTDPTNKNGSIYSLINWYLIRDEWYIPEPIMTAAEVHFLKAEAYARGLGASLDLTTAETEYKAGITASVNFWYKIAGNTKTASEDWTAVAPSTPTTLEMQTFLANPKVLFTGTAADALSKIYAQEWLSYFRQPWLAFNLWRRTGSTPVDASSNPTSAYTTFYRLPYAQDEAVNNTDNYNTQISKMGGNNTNYKVWWMK
ncbi:SusD/RagB family nutrient-binding outer membrane lipoprotein [Chitinophaga sp. CF118]|uniref:SusD/RagB family nutrient-binding outer membrane lipoprotein n=1 Tax=Chitinophaga sp. CF118 TaxID=1884367 RepID=UPI0015A643B9|nr:SusD/RagB family nutrient-binding outer membrane lipoprotein [Chitinophaga sp. CF118]